MRGWLGLLRPQVSVDAPTRRRWTTAPAKIPGAKGGGRSLATGECAMLRRATRPMTRPGGQSDLPSQSLDGTGDGGLDLDPLWPRFPGRHIPWSSSTWSSGRRWTQDTRWPPYARAWAGPSRCSPSWPRCSLCAAWAGCSRCHCATSTSPSGPPEGSRQQNVRPTGMGGCLPEGRFDNLYNALELLLVLLNQLRRSNWSPQTQYPCVHKVLPVAVRGRMPPFHLLLDAQGELD
jgi:hypothetical protein